jgi:hypothetical protein
MVVVADFRRKVKGWSANVEAKNRTRKERHNAEYESLDVRSESKPLTVHEKGRLKEIGTELNKIWCVEETNARQSFESIVNLVRV